MGSIIEMLILPFNVSVFYIFFHVPIVLLIRKKLLKIKEIWDKLVGKKDKKDED